MKKIILLTFLLLTQQLYSQWITLNSGVSQNLISVNFINSQTGFAAGAGGVIIRTTNGGINWTALVSGSSSDLMSIQFLNLSTGLVCGYNGTILRTTNGGTNWTPVASGTTTQLLGLSFFNESNGICGGNSGTTIYTTDGGVNWLTGYPTGYMVSFFSAYMLNASTGYCAGVNTIFSPLVAKTTNGGANWVYSSFMLNNNEGTLRDIYFDTSKGIAVSVLWNGTGGISRTTNAGVNWTTLQFAQAFLGVDFPTQLIGYAVGAAGFIFKSTDAGIGWNQQISGTSAILTSVDFTDSLVGYTAGYGGVILKTTNGGMVGISSKSKEIPSQYKLYQNYPNPFNPSTTIKFDIPKSSHVKIVIYDMLGREIEELLNEEKKPRSYEVTWDGSRCFSSGVYFYKLITDEFAETKKMVLMK
jgi:photosystem II stability/assembly factor-like uncharacterized protein